MVCTLSLQLAVAFVLLFGNVIAFNNGHNVRDYFSLCHIRQKCSGQKCSNLFASSTIISESDESPNAILKSKGLKSLHNKLDKEYIGVAFPAFLSIAAEPLVALADSMYVGRLGAVQQAGMGIAISAMYSISKLYNDPLLKTSTSLVAGKSGEELSESVATAIKTAMVIGVLQSLVFFFLSNHILSFLSVPLLSEMRDPALSYLKWRALGVPAATVLLVSNGIFRGRGDTITPLYCTSIGNLMNILLDPFLIFGLQMGCGGAGAAMTISQWITVVPLLYILNKSIPFNIFKSNKKDASLKSSELESNTASSFGSYAKATGLILLRTIAKISAYTVTSAAAASLGTVPMAAYSLTFNLGFTASQLCESIAVAAQALLARDMPFKTQTKKASARHIIKRSIQLGFLVSAALVTATIFNLDKVLMSMTNSPEVRAAAKAVMPIVFVAQMFKGISSATGGILLGGLDWAWSSGGVQFAAILCILCTKLLPQSLWNIWLSLTIFMAVQVIISGLRVCSGTGPWTGLNLFLKLPWKKRVWEDDSDGKILSKDSNVSNSIRNGDSVSNSENSSTADVLHTGSVGWGAANLTKHGTDTDSNSQQATTSTTNNRNDDSDNSNNTKKIGEVEGIGNTSTNDLIIASDIGTISDTINIMIIKDGKKNEKREDEKCKI